MDKPGMFRCDKSGCSAGLKILFAGMISCMIAATSLVVYVLVAI